MKVGRVVCRHCGAVSSVASCGSCGRRFIITAVHFDGHHRELVSVKTEIKQVTCPVCHAESLTDADAQANATPNT
jgi:hypothetical protein